MEKTQDHFLGHLVEGEPTFRPEPFYNSHGDCVELYLADEEVVADRIDQIITIFRSVTDNRPIGFQIKGVSALLDLLDASHVRIEVEGTGDKIHRVTVTTFKVLVMAALKKSLGCQETFRRIDRFADLLDALPPDIRGQELAISRN